VADAPGGALSPEYMEVRRGFTNFLDFVADAEAHPRSPYNQSPDLDWMRAFLFSDIF
jgi:hypothetical protein